MKNLFLSTIGLLIGAVSTMAQTAEWSVVSTLPSGRPLMAVASPSQSTFVAVGTFGRITRSIDAGVTWNDVPSGLPDDFGSSLLDLSFGSAQTGTTVGGVENILHTTDGGASWTKGEIGIETYLTSVFFLNENFGMVTSLPLMKTRDGGRNWEVMVFAMEGSIKDILFLDTLHGIAVGPAGFSGAGTIFRSDDGGETWSFVHVEGTGFGQFHQIAFADEHGLIVGSSGMVLRTEDAGQTWSLIESGVEVELLAVAMRDRMNAIAVGAGGTIIRTTDGGRSWEQETSPTTEALRGVSIDESGTAVAVGGDNNGLVLRRQSIPSSVRNPKEDADGRMLKVFPNPALGTTRIEWSNLLSGSGGTEARTIVIRDLLGKEMKRFAIGNDAGSIVWDAEELPSGLYFVTLISDGSSQMKQVSLTGR